MNVTREKLFKLLKSGILFRDIPDNFVQWVLERSQVLQFDPQQFVYEKEAQAEKLYLVIAGEVALFLRDEGEDYLINGCQASDYFGFEVLAKEPQRMTNAQALHKTVVLAIPQKVILKLTEEFPTFSFIPDLQLQSLSFLLRKPMDWLQDDEVVHYINREHPLILVTRLVRPILLGLVMLVLTLVFFNAGVISADTAIWLGSIVGLLGIAWGVWNAFDWANDFFVVTNQRVVFLEKIALFYDSRKETPLSAILSITKQTSLTGRMVHYGDVVLRTFTGLLKFHNVAHVEAVSAIIDEQWVKMKNRMAVEEEDPEQYLRKQLLEKTPSTEELVQSKGKPKTGKENLSEGYVPDFLSRLLKLRVVEAETIVYRTHWFVFIRKTILPFLGLLTCLIFLFAPQKGWFGLVAEGTQTYSAILIGVAIVMGLWWIFSTIDWRNDYFLITPDQIVDVYRKPLGMEERRAAPLRNIQTIEYKRQSLFGLLFNFGTVFIRVGDVEFTFDYVPNPSYVQQEIFTRFQMVKDREKQENADLNNERLSNWMDAYHKVKQGSPSRGDDEIDED